MKIIALNHNNLSNQKDISKRNTCSFLLPQNYKLLKTDTVSFKKQYTPQERGMEDVSVVELMAHNYLDLRRKDWGSSIVYDDLTPHNISDKLKENFLDVITKVGPAVHADANLVEWKTFLNTDYKMASCKGVNKARSDRLRDYSAVNRINIDKTFLAQDMALYIDKLKNNSAYQFLAMIIAFNDVKKSNRHIPLPFNVQVLAKTFAQIDENREIMSIDKLSKLYHSNLIEYALINNPERIIHIDDKAPVSDMKHCWICVPGRTKDDVIQNNFINLVEIFSNINWCTHSREDKARAQVETGDFFVYLKRDEDNNWIPMTAISTNNRYKKQEQLGVIELQGIKNNYILTNEDYDRIKLLMQKIDKKLIFKHRDINDNVPTACVQMSIMKYLEKGSPLANAISEIRNANEQIYDMKAQSVKYREKIKLLKPSPNLSMEYSERLKTESEIQQLNEQAKALEQKILNIKEKNKVLYNNLFQVIGANPTSTEYSVINTMKVLNKVLDYDLKDITYDNINILFFHLFLDILLFLLNLETDNIL